MRKRINLAFVPLLAATIALAGCSSSKTDKADPALPDAASLLSQSAATTKTETSTHLVFKVSGDKPIIKVQELTGDLTTSPATAAKGTAKLDFGGSSVEGNFIVVDGDLYADLLGGMQDYGKAADIYDPSIILDPTKGLANLLANVKDAKSEGRDTVDGVDSVRITGTLSKDALNTFAGLTPQTNAKPLTADVPTKVWVANGGKNELTRISIDTSPGNTIEMSLSDWGKPVSVSKP